MPVGRLVKLLPLGTVDDLMHNCIRPSASCSSSSGRPWHLGVIVLTILHTGKKRLQSSLLNLINVTGPQRLIEVKHGEKLL